VKNYILGCRNPVPEDIRLKCRPFGGTKKCPSFWEGHLKVCLTTPRLRATDALALPRLKKPNRR
jgi:hypothetical protein